MNNNRNYCWERVKAGAATGGVLGLCVGTMYGLWGIVGLRDVGMGTRMQLLARTVAASAVSFGFFLAVGSGIRCEPQHLAGSRINRKSVQVVQIPAAAAAVEQLQQRHS